MHFQVTPRLIYDHDETHSAMMYAPSVCYINGDTTIKQRFTTDTYRVERRCECLQILRRRHPEPLLSKSDTADTSFVAARCITVHPLNACYFYQSLTQRSKSRKIKRNDLVIVDRIHKWRVIRFDFQQRFVRIHCNERFFQFSF